jgi:arginyl-tRNA synthetase
VSDFLSKRDGIVQALRRHVQERYEVDVPIVPSVPPEVAMGDVGFPLAFGLAKALRRPPREIAEELVREIGEIEGVSRLEVAGAGYVNAYLRRGQFLADLVKRPPGPRAGSAGGKVVVEHTNINPNKAAHIGHLRNAVLGDTLVRLFRHAGRSVEVQNYIDDTGVQVADVVVGFEVLEEKGLEEVRAIERLDHHCWDLYARVTRWYEEDDARRGERSRVLQAMEEGEGETAELAALVAERVAECHLRTMERLGVRYDLLTHESDILRHHFWEAAFLRMRNRGVVHEESEGRNEGCWVMELASSEEFAGMEDADKVLVRSDGTVTYVGKDIAYQMWKFGVLGKDFRYGRHPFSRPDYELWTTRTEEPEEGRSFGGAERVYNVIDVRQSYLQKVVKESLRASGFEEQAEASIHYAYEFVALSPQAAREMGVAGAGEEGKALGMSGRQGLGVKADDLIDMLEETARREVAQRNPEMDAEEVNGIGHALAVSALRYFMLKFTRNKLIAFDFEEALAFEGETGPYLQYSVVRARNILRKLEEAERWQTGRAREHAEDSVFALLEDPETGDEVWGLVRLIGRLGEFLELALSSEEQAHLARYAFNLAQSFNHFYHKHYLLQERDDGIMADRAVIVEVFLREMERVLDLLGIEAPQRM